MKSHLILVMSDRSTDDVYDAQCMIFSHTAIASCCTSTPLCIVYISLLPSWAEICMSLSFFPFRSKPISISLVRFLHSIPVFIFPFFSVLLSSCCSYCMETRVLSFGLATLCRFSTVVPCYCMLAEPCSLAVCPDVLGAQA